jgi:hypothetical protein
VAKSFSPVMGRTTKTIASGQSLAAIWRHGHKPMQLYPSGAPRRWLAHRSAGNYDPDTIARRGRRTAVTLPDGTAVQPRVWGSEAVQFMALNAR